MACRLVGTKPLSEPMMDNFYLDHMEKTWLYFNQNSYIFIEENAVQNVAWKVTAICVGLNLLKYKQWF